MHSMLTSLSHQRLTTILDENHPISHDDLVWVLDYIRQKLAHPDPKLVNMPQERLLNNFHSFAEITMFMMNRRKHFNYETNRLRQWIKEATYGLQPDPADES